MSLWYLNRATGVVSLVLLTAVVLLGILVRRDGTVAGLPRFVVSGLHRNLALMVLAFLALHVGTAVIDGYVPIRIVDAVVPFVSAYQPLWVGLGAVALDLLIAIIVTSLLRLRLGPRVWRAVHWTTYAMWPVAAVHSIGGGTDAAHGWGLWLVLICAAAVGAAVVWRLSAPEPRLAGVR